MAPELVIAHYAPASRLLASTSRFLADSLFGGGIVLVIGLALLLAFLAKARAGALGEEERKKRGLRPGPILLCGLPEPIDEPPASGAFIELVIDQSGTQHQHRGRHYVTWTESARTLKHQPFYLRTESGERVRVEPQGRVELIDALEAPQRHGTSAKRRRIARITPGEKIWVRGLLSGDGWSAGPYRGAGGGGYVLLPGGRDPLLVSSQPIDLEDEQTARFHGIFGFGFVALLALLQLVVFADYRALRREGVRGEARIDGIRQWITHSKNSTTHHFGWTLIYHVPGGALSTEVETNGYAFSRLTGGDTVPIVYVPRSPAIVQLGTEDEVAMSAGTAMFGLLTFGGLGGLYIGLSRTRRPWWRRKRIVDVENGML